MSHLPTSKYAALKTAINADANFASLVAISDWPAIVNALNLQFLPSYWVLRTDVSRSDIYFNTSIDGTTWSFTIYKGQSVPEQGAWSEIFSDGRANFALANVTAAISAIFGAANANTVHCKAIGKRTATYGEKIFASGAGTQANPSTMSFEGNLDSEDVRRAMLS